MDGLWKMAKAMLDTGADYNLIDRRFLAKHAQLEEFSDAPGLTAVGNIPIPTFGVCRLYVKVRDATGHLHSSLLRFVVADIAPFTILLGQPWMELALPVFDHQRKLFTYPPPLRHCGLFVEPEHQWGTFGVLVAALTPGFGDPDDSPVPPTRDVPEAYRAYEDLFASHERLPLPNHHAREHRIDLEPGSEPPWGPIYPLNHVELQKLREWLAEALRKGWIQLSVSPAGAPILFVPKKGGDLRLVVDYRALNARTIKNRAALPLIGEILDRLSGAQMYTKLDLKDAYYRIRIRAGDEWKTAFRTRYGHYEFRVMPMGLANAPATFQAYINQALAGLVDVTCIVYLDDILVFSEDRAQHEQHVREVLDRLRKADLYVNRDKCEFHVTQVSFLGYIVSPGGIAMEPQRIEAIARWPLPTSVHEIQVFLGFTGFYRRFIRKYSHITAALTDLLRGNQTGPFELTQVAREAFLELLQRFQEAPILVHFDPQLPIRVETDASKRAVGAVLSQLVDGRWHPVAFRSRKLTAQEVGYDTADRELLALVDAFRTWRHYLLYAVVPVLALTDHMNLQTLQTKGRLSTRQLRYSVDFAEFNFVIQFRPGKQNPADGLSRRPDLMEEDEREPRENPLIKLIEQGIERGKGFDSATAPRVGKQGNVGFVAAVSGPQEPGCAVISPGLRSLDDVLEPDESELVAAVLGPQEPGCAVISSGLRGLGGILEPDESTEDQPADPVQGHRAVLLTRGAKRRSGNASKLADDEKRLRVGDAHESEEDENEETQTSNERGSPDHREAFVGAVGGSGMMSQKTWDSRMLAAQKADAWIASGAWKTMGKRWEQAEDGFLRLGTRIFVPEALRTEVLNRYHDKPTAGHEGIRKMEKRLRRYFYWQSLRADIEHHVQHCFTCARTKSRRHRPYGELASLPVPSQPWADISVDFVTGLPTSIDPRTNKACDAILVVVDRFTKYALYIATRKTLTASAFANLFLDHVYRPFGLPTSIVSDRGSLFTSNFWQTLCAHLAIEQRLSTAYHPQTDGQTERQNQALEHYLRVFCAFDQADWADQLILAEHAYNTSYHTATRTTPAFLLYGFQPRGPSDPLAQETRGVPAADERAREMVTRRAQVRELLTRANESYAKWYNKKRMPMKFNAGDWVWLSAKHIKQQRPSSKLADKFLGPFQVEKSVGTNDMAYRLKLPSRYKLHPTFPISLLEPYQGSEEEARKHQERIDIESEAQEYEVEAILAHRGPWNARQYLIKWAGYPAEDNSWEPAAHINDGPLFRAYEASHRRTRSHRHHGEN